ncbi:hypothetical protein [Secundilactobacillus kimchicus]|uniref:hypothetical protein n=1 Tax=Secundilactobacillus kimchicus TaxID=528209 RepID=UPI0024A8D7AB|nr:hypothetical protein [Secundilactobacillus kimchicus]
MKHKVISLCAALLTTIAIAPLGASAASTAINTTTNGETSNETQSSSIIATSADSTNIIDVTPNNIELGSGFVPYNATKTLLAARKYKNGVSKVVSHGRNSATIYFSKHDAQLIVTGAGIVIGGYTGGTLGIILGLVGLYTKESIKGGLWVRVNYVKGAIDGQLHMVLGGWGWQ